MRKVPGKKITYFFHFFRFFDFGWGALPPRPPGFWLGGQSPLRRLPLNGRSSHLIEAAKRGRLDQMIFFDAADDRPAGRLAGRLAGRPAERPNGRTPGLTPDRTPGRTLDVLNVSCL